MDSETKDAIHNLELAVSELSRELADIKIVHNVQTVEQDDFDGTVVKRLEELERLLQTSDCCRAVKLRTSRVVHTASEDVKNTQSGRSTAEIEPQNSSDDFCQTCLSMRCPECTKKGKLEGLRKLFQKHKDKECIGQCNLFEELRSEISKLESELK